MYKCIYEVRDVGSSTWIQSLFMNFNAQTRNIFKVILLYTVSTEEIWTSFTDHPLTSCFQKSACYADIKISNILPPINISIVIKKAEFKVTPEKYLITHKFYFADEFLMFTNNTKPS
jgi:hypothetical protein